MESLSRPLDRSLRSFEAGDLTDQVRRLLASDSGLSDTAKALAAAALNGPAELRARLARLPEDDIAEAGAHAEPEQASHPGQWFIAAASERLDGHSRLHDALSRFLGLGAIAVAEQALRDELADARTARRQAIDALDRMRAALADCADPRAAAAARLLAHAATVDLGALAELATSTLDAHDVRDLDAVVALRVPDDGEVCRRVRALRAQPAPAGGPRDERAQLWRMRRELSDLLADYPGVAALPGVAADVTGRYLVARSAARAMALWMREAETVEPRMLELADALRAVHAAAVAARAALDEREVAWTPVAGQLRHWIEQSREIRATATRVRALAEAEEWIVRNGKALCAA